MTSEIERYIRRLFENYGRKLRNVVARGTVSMVQDERKMQENQIELLDGEMIDGAERAQQYGFSSHPQAGSECFVVFCGAAREHPIILSVDDRRYRVKGIKAGEVVIYTDEGDAITLKRSNTIEIKTKHLIVKAEDDVSIETKTFSVSASVGIDMTTPQTGIHTDALDFSGASGGDTSAVMSGSMTASNDLLANSGAVSLRGHVHDGVQSGQSTTDKPVGG